MKKVLITLAVFGSIFLSACGTAATERAGLPEVHDRINAMTDCNELQVQFDTAVDNHGRDIQRNRLDLAKMSTAYMETTLKRQQELKCPGFGG